MALANLQHIFPPVEVAIKLAISLAVGTLVGLEREWAQKDVGVRTFAITSMAGMLAALLGRQFSIAVLIGVLLLVVCINLRVLLVNRSLEITTSAALIAVTVIGILTGGATPLPRWPRQSSSPCCGVEDGTDPLCRRSHYPGSPQCGSAGAVKLGDLSASAQPFRR